MVDPPYSLGGIMDSLVEPRWPPALAVMKVSDLGRLGAPGCQREASSALKRRKDEARTASWAVVPGPALSFAICVLFWVSVSYLRRDGDRPGSLMVS